MTRTAVNFAENAPNTGRNTSSPQMPITANQQQALDDACNRLASEIVLAQAGSDEGLIPAYSLLSDLAAAADDQLRPPIEAVRAKLDALLEAARPFDAASLGELRRLAEWLGPAIDARGEGRDAPEWAADAGSTEDAPEHGGPVASGAAFEERVLELNMAENAELLAEFHAEAIDHLAQIESSLLVLDGNPRDRDALNQIFRSFHTIKGVSGFLQLGPMHTLTHEVESLLDLARNGRLLLTPVIITAILQSRDAVQAMVRQITEALEKGKTPDVIVPVGHLIRAVKELAANPESTTLTEAPFPGIGARPSSQPEAPAAGEPRSGPSSTVRVNTEKLDSMMNVVGELVIVQSQIAESAKDRADADSQLSRNISQLGRITKELQRNAMALRLMPIKPTFQKMERLVRDLARDFGKNVCLHTDGEDTEVDRTVVEEIADPLVHMVRNAMDHGLESVADRLIAGKPEQGTLRLRAYNQGSQIIVELSDDGRGIDPDRILRKAVEKGVVPEGASLSRDEILQLIFAPGFSTAEKVTSVSGRGVGMDVVKRNIDKLRGSVDILTEIGRGTTFRIRLPLTTAIIDGLVVRVGADRFILPSTSVQMALRPERASIGTVHGRGEIYDHRGRILPVQRLHRHFRIQGAIERPEDGILVIVESQDRVSALLVDEMVSKQEVVVKNLGGFLSSLPGIAGGAILGDGDIALILDPATLSAA